MLCGLCLLLLVGVVLAIFVKEEEWNIIQERKKWKATCKRMASNVIIENESIPNNYHWEKRYWGIDPMNEWEELTYWRRSNVRRYQKHIHQYAFQAAMQYTGYTQEVPENFEKLYFFKNKEAELIVRERPMKHELCMYVLVSNDKE